MQDQLLENASFPCERNDGFMARRHEMRVVVRDSSFL
jgi:hypothetical protein